MTVRHALYPHSVNLRVSIFLSLFASASFLGSAGFAAAVTWDSLSGGNWNLGSNWSGGAVPGASDDVFLPQGYYPVEISEFAAAGSLLAGGSGWLAISGTLNTGSATLGTVGETTAWVDGASARWTGASLVLGHDGGLVTQNGGLAEFETITQNSGGYTIVSGTGSELRSSSMGLGMAGTLTVGMGGVANFGTFTQNSGASTTVSGADSELRGTDMVLGTASNLTVQDGASVDFATISQHSTITRVTGTGSKLQSGHLEVTGLSGQVALGIVSGAVMTTGSASVFGGTTDPSNPVVRISGAGSRWDSDGEIQLVSPGYAVEVGAGAVLSTVRVSGSGTLLGAGGTLQGRANEDHFLEIPGLLVGSGGVTIDTNGFNLGSAATITGTASSSLIKVGSGTFAHRGAVSQVSSITVREGTLALSGPVEGGGDFFVGGSGALFFNGQASRQAGTILVGSSGTGSLTVAQGVLSADVMQVGGLSSSGSLTVGSGANLITGTGGIVGGSGAVNGGTWSTHVLTMNSGSARVASGGLLEATGESFDAMRGHSTLEVDSGGRAELRNFYAGLDGNDNVSVVVTGAGSRLDFTGTGQIVGNSSLLVSEGGMVRVDEVFFVGKDSEGSAVASVTGPGSRLEMIGSGTMLVRGGGRLLVENGAVASVDALDVGLLDKVVLSGGGVLEAASVTTYSGSAIVFNGGTLRMTGSSLIGGDLTLEGQGVLDQQTDLLSVRSTFSGTGNLTLNLNSGTLSMSGPMFGGAASAHSGTTVVVGGVLQAAEDQVFSASSTYRLQEAILDLNDTHQTIGNLVSGSSAIVMLGSGTLSTGANNASSAFNGTIIGDGVLRKVGTGTMTLLNAPNHSGETVVGAGVLSFAIPANLAGGVVVGDISGDDGTLLPGLGLAASSIIVGRGEGSNGRVILSSGTLSSRSLEIGSSGTGRLSIAAGLVSVDGLVRVGTHGGGDGILVLSGSSGNRGVLSTDRVIKGEGSARLIFDGGVLRANENQSDFLADFHTGIISLFSGGAYLDSNGFEVGISTVLSGLGGLSKIGSGVLTLTSANTYTGGTTIEAGKLVAAHNGEVGTFAAGSTVTVNASGTLQVNGSDSLGWGHGNARLVVNGGTVTTDGTAGQHTTLQDVSMTGGRLTDAGGNGQYFLNGGLVTHASAASAVIDSWRLELGGGWIPGSTSFTVADGTAAVDLDIASEIIGTGSLVKAGAGLMRLTGRNGYLGGTTVEEGALVVDGSITGGVLVQSGASLGGSGRIGGGVTVFAGGTLSPGTSPGQLTLLDSLNLDDGATLLLEFSEIDAFDQLDVQGLFTAGGTLSLQLVDGYVPNFGDSFQIFNGATPGFDEGEFLLVSNLGGGLFWDVSSLQATGIVSVVPEPSASVLLVSAAAVFLVLRRRASALAEIDPDLGKKTL